MSLASQTTDHGCLTIVTLRVSFQDSTFSPSFRDHPKTSGRTKFRCSCQQLGDLRPGPNLKNLMYGLLPPDRHTVCFVVMDAAKVEQARRLCTPQANQPFENSKEFRFWICSLSVLLSELCGSDHACEDPSVPQDFAFRPFRTGSLSNKTVCKDLGRLLNTPLSPSEKQGHGMGYVYILRSQMGPNTIAHLKIGFSKFHPEHRAHELARCLARPEVVSHTPLIPHAKRLESIVHMELQACRKIRPCPRCRKDHREWFTVSHADSREVLTRWSTWILQRPYVDGMLTKEWKDHLETRDLAHIDENKSPASFWTETIDDFPQGGSKDDRSRRIGRYLNDCYWDVMCDQLGISFWGKDYCDSLREDVPLESGTGSSANDLKTRLAAMVERFLDIPESDNGRDIDFHISSASVLPEAFTRPNISHKGPIDLETPLSAIFSTNTYLGRMLHPETKSCHLQNADGSPGPLLRLWQCREQESKNVTQDLLKLFVSMKTLKTGAFSVSDPTLGITESPLGDATMLPVLAIKDLANLNPTVMNWVGMNPTNRGFQSVQEALASGRRFDREPRFQPSKAYSMAGNTSLPTGDASVVAERIAKAFRDEGIDVTTHYNYITDSDSCVSSDSPSEDAGQVSDTPSNPVNFPTVPAKRKKESNNSTEWFDTKKARSWLQSLE